MSTNHTLFPHEPLVPTTALHLQGAFLPRSRRPNESLPPTTTQCHCSSPTYIESSVHARLALLMTSFAMNPNTIVAVHAITEDVSKVRIELINSFVTRQLVDRLKRREYSPSDFISCECGAKFASKALQITHVACTDAIPEEEDVRWGRAAPPKFQRIINTDDMEARRSVTRFVYVENVAGWDVDLNLYSEMEEMKQCLVSILDADAALLESIMRRNANGTGMSNSQLTPSDIQDDIRQAFQDGLRQSVAAHDSSSLGVELFMKSDTSQKKQKKKSNESSHSNVYSNFHIGMRSHQDAANLIQDRQGKSIQIQINLPPTFTSLFAHNNNTEPQKATITINKLFLDYADILLPKRIRTNNPEQQPIGLPSRSECTSKTSHIHIPGLHLLPHYITHKEEAVLLAALTGPEAPWAPEQRTPSGGQIKRRVQHYGYVFDYESADVLRCRSGNSGCCPPLPAVNDSDMKGDIEDWIEEKVKERRGWEVLAGVIERTRRMDFVKCFREEEMKGENHGLDEQVEAMSLNKNDGCLSTDQNGVGCQMSNGQGYKQQSDCSTNSGTYPNINQLTINEYTPGQGIGSHVDTETAFADGLLIITLNGGIVMEFRKVGDIVKKLVYLPPQSLILISGEARYHWEHMIVSRTTDTVDGEVIPRKLRVSLTLRTALSAPVEGEEAPLTRFESTCFPPYWGQPADAEGTDMNDKTSVDRSDLITPSTESKHVHAVYDAIATQWHHTRGKRGVLWPGATQFLENLPPGSIVADVGCGDGKYFSAILGAGSFVIGTDISEALLRTACCAEKSTNGPQYQELSHEKLALSSNPAVAVADCIHLPFKSGSFDAAICIAVMHHLSTRGRRIRCLAELARVVKVGGLINVQAWALEQEDDSKRKFHGADVLVPFNAQPKYLQASVSQKDGDSSTRDSGANGKGVAQMLSESFHGTDFDSKKNLVIFQRYCHMYRQGELEDLVSLIPTLQLVESAYEKGNHVVLVRVVAFSSELTE